MQHRPDAIADPVIVDEMEQGQEEEERPNQDIANTMYVYRTESGGILITPHRVELDDEELPSVESDRPATDQRLHPGKSLPIFLQFLLVLLLFVLLDMADSQLVAFLTPTAMITITPVVKMLTLRSTAHLGKTLAPITVSESLTVPATGHGHQDATQATGTLTFYNGLAMVQTIAAGTVLTGQDGIQVVVDQSLTVPSNNPPNDGEAQASAHALQPGANGNVAAEDINTTLATGLYVKNLTPFTGGESARDFQVVTSHDITTAAATLTAKVSRSMTAALVGQLLPGQALTPTTCPPTVAADHAVGDEATAVQVTVSETCTAIAYDTTALHATAMQLLTAQAAKTLGTGYIGYGNITVTVTQAATQPHGVFLSFTGQGTWVYQVNQAHIQALVSGKPRLEALQLLAHLPGIQQVSISGIPDNQFLPDDVTHIHLLIVVAAF